MKVLKYIKEIISDGRKLSIQRIGYILIILTACTVIFYLLLHKQPIDWYGISTFTSLASGFLTVQRHIELTNYSNNSITPTQTINSLTPTQDEENEMVKTD
jgi:hypothetical protein